LTSSTGLSRDQIGRLFQHHLDLAEHGVVPPPFDQWLVDMGHAPTLRERDLEEAERDPDGFARKLASRRKTAQSAFKKSLEPLFALGREVVRRHSSLMMELIGSASARLAQRAMDGDAEVIEDMRSFEEARTLKRSMTCVSVLASIRIEN
jgi:hypothetical protein